MELVHDANGASYVYIDTNASWFAIQVLMMVPLSSIMKLVSLALACLSRSTASNPHQIPTKQ